MLYTRTAFAPICAVSASHESYVPSSGGNSEGNLPGNAARSYAPDGARMIVPADTEERYAASSLAEAL